MHQWWSGVFEKGTGFTNPYKHLLSCLFDNDEDHLMLQYSKRRNAKRLFGCTALDMEVIDVTKTQQAMYGYLQLIMMKSLLISYVGDPVARAFKPVRT